MRSIMRIKSDHDAKISFWPASGSVVSCQLSGLDGADGGGMGTVWVGICSLAFWSVDVSISCRRADKMELHTEELKDGIAQD
jgi:hypothetical protein